MMHRNILPSDDFCSPLQPVYRPALQWFGASRYSDVGQGILADNRISVKRFRPHGRFRFSERRLESALKEWEKVVSHPNIQVFLGLFPPNSESAFPMLVTPYMVWNVMDYIQTNPKADKVMLMNHIAVAIEYMHGQDLPVIHGNVKGSNILVDGNGTAYLSDIGIHQVLSTPKQLGYEVRWMAPEKVLNNQPHTPACDVWSFAMTVLEVYTGHHPFQNYAREATVVLAMERGYIPLRPLGGAMADDGVWALLEHCWDYTPSQRPSMTTVLSQISSYNASGVSVPA